MVSFLNIRCSILIFMNKFLVISIGLAVMFLAVPAQGIVFIPPVIYIVTLSLGSFFFNIFIFVAFWLAINGYINRSYFGKPFHKIVALIFGLAGKGILLSAVAILPILVFKPTDVIGIVVASLGAGLLCFATVFLVNYREYRWLSFSERVPILKSATFLFVLAIIITYTATTLALKPKVYYNNENVFNDNITKAANKTVPERFFETGSNRNASGMQAAPYRGTFADNAALRSSAEVSSGKLWFMPENSSVCNIFFDDKMISSVMPKSDCFYYKNNQRERTTCPVNLTVSEIPPNIAIPKEQHRVIGSGSCVGNYAVVLDGNTFQIKNSR